MADILKMPKLGFDMAEGTLVRWVKAEGETINKGEVLAEIETDKATVEVESTFSGVIYRHLVEQGSIVPVGAAISVIAQPGEEVKDLPELEGSEGSTKDEKPAPAAQAAATGAAPTAPAALDDSGRLTASPLARRMALERGIDLRLLRGSGPGGRIVKRDLENFIPVPAVVSAPAQTAASAPAVKSTAAPLPLPVWGAGQTPADEVIPMDRLRQAIARRMVESKQQLPHFYVTHEYDMEALLALRKEVNAILPDEQKLSVNDFIVKAVGAALRRFPAINASIQGDKIVRHGAVNVGVAVALESGLMTVVVRDADQKPLRVISAEVKDMVARARTGKVRPDDIEGSTFSISNLGMFDVEHFIAIINPPEAAILAVGSAKPVPAVVDGALTVRTRMKATISADHRVTDGAQAAQFMQALAEYIEKPVLMMV
jgi:pyruvate dehydrogenase E2 component (dihydrolipoamide acetyltransferase)